jgi:hypothetical protein
MKMDMNKLICSLMISIPLVACAAKSKPPSQVVYRFDDNRYLELVGYDCEGALYYHDKKNNINSAIHDNPMAPYKIFTKTFIHPSDKYILIPGWEPLAYTISKDYGKTWQVAEYMSSTSSPEKDADGYPVDSPDGSEIERIVVVNDQAFITSSKGHLYISSYPFDDERLRPNGPGIDYTYFDDMYYLYRPNPHHLKGELVHDHIDSQSPGAAWGTVIFMKQSLKGLWEAHKKNYINLPDKEPEIKNYKGWIKMSCNYYAGR